MLCLLYGGTLLMGSSLARLNGAAVSDRVSMGAAHAHVRGTFLIVLGVTSVSVSPRYERGAQ
jgi:hypothetical protein